MPYLIVPHCAGCPSPVAPSHVGVPDASTAGHRRHPCVRGRTQQGGPLLHGTAGGIAVDWGGFTDSHHVKMPLLGQN